MKTIFCSVVALLLSANAFAYDEVPGINSMEYRYTAEDIRDSHNIQHQDGHYEDNSSFPLYFRTWSSLNAGPNSTGAGCAFYGQYKQFIGHGKIKAHIDLAGVVLYTTPAPFLPNFRADLVTDVGTRTLDWKDFWDEGSPTSNPTIHDVIVDHQEINREIDLEVDNVSDENSVEVRLCLTHGYVYVRSITLTFTYDSFPDN